MKKLSFKKLKLKHAPYQVFINGEKIEDVSSISTAMIRHNLTTLRMDILIKKIEIKESSEGEFGQVLIEQ